MKRASNPQRYNLFGPPGGRQVHGPRNAHPVAADDYLLRGIDVGHPDAGLASDLFQGHLVHADDCRHRAGVFFASLLHQLASHLNEPSGVGYVQHPGHGQCAILAEAVTRHDHRLGQLILVEALLHGHHTRQAHRHDTGLCVYGLPQLLLGPIEHDPGQRPAQGVVDLLEHLASSRRLLVKLPTHPNRLGALAREQVGDLRPVGLGLKCKRHDRLLERLSARRCRITRLSRWERLPGRCSIRSSGRPDGEAGRCDTGGTGRRSSV